MEPFDISNPDDLVKDLLRGIFGPSAVITVTFIAVNAAWSWYGTIRGGAKFARSSYAAASRNLRRMPAVAVFLGVVTSIVLLVLQATWLWVSFIVGNAISYLFTGEVPRDGPQWGTVLRSLQWDDITTVYVALSVLVLVASYVLEYRGMEITGLVVFISLPSIFWAMATALLLALALLVAGLYWLSDGRFEPDPVSRPALLVLVLSVVHISACFAALDTPRLMFRIWKSASGLEGGFAHGGA